jgi:hypothetical protein
MKIPTAAIIISLLLAALGLAFAPLLNAEEKPVNGYNLSGQSNSLLDGCGVGIGSSSPWHGAWMKRWNTG